MNAGKQIKTEREKRGLSQTDLAKVFGTTQPTICKYENGTLPLVDDMIVAFAEYFGVSTDYLLGLKDE